MERKEKAGEKEEVGRRERGEGRGREVIVTSSEQGQEEGAQAGEEVGDPSRRLGAGGACLLKGQGTQVTD